MTHTGKWEGRTKMAWWTWGVGASMVAIGSIGLFLGNDTSVLIISGTSLITGIVAIMVAGKVAHDKGSA